jgi:hypothetical protein
MPLSELARSDLRLGGDGTLLAQAAAGVGADVQRELKTIEGVAAEVGRLKLFEQLDNFMPAPDLFVGGTMMLIIVLVHATGLRLVTARFEYRMRKLHERPSTWQPDVTMSGAVVLLLILHLLEIYIWAAALVNFDLVEGWRDAGFIAANTYTAVGYGDFAVPPGWHMLAPFLALSGLFSIGWSGSLLVEIVRRCQEVKALARRERSQRRQGGKRPPPSA